MKAVAQILLSACVVAAVSSIASAQVTLNVSGTPAPRATRSDYTALAGRVVLRSSAAGPAGTLATSLTLDYGAPITNGPQPIDSGTSETDSIQVIVSAAENCEYNDFNRDFLYPFVTHQSGRITLLLPAVAPGNCGSATITVDHVRLALNGSSVPAALSVTAGIADPGVSRFSIAPPTSVTVISNVLTALANPSLQAAAGGTAVVLLDRTVVDSTWGFDISENYVDAWRQAAQMSPIVTNDTNLLLTVTGIPPGVTLNLTGGGPVTISSSSLTQSFPAGNLSTTFLTSTANTAVLSFTGLSFPLSETLIETIRFRGTVGLDSESSLASGTIGVQVSMTPNFPGGSCLGEIGPEPCPSAPVPRFEHRPHPSSPLPIVSIVSSVTLSVSSTSLTFAHVMNQAPPASQSILVTSSAPVVITTTVSSGANWLTAGPTSANTPASIAVGVSPSGLPSGTYSGTVVIASSAANNSPLILPITLRVLTPLSVSPATLSFSHIIGSAAPSAQSISVMSGSTVPFNASVTTTNGGNWLSASPASGSSPGRLDVSISPGALGPGVYNGIITISSALGSNSPITVPVTLRVTSRLRVSPQELTFRYTIGSALPEAQSISVDSDASVDIQISSTTASGGGWLLTSPASVSTPGRIIVSVNITGLGVGSYLGTVTLTSPSASGPQMIPVRLTVESSISVSPSSLSFSHIIGASVPASQSFSVTAVSSLNFTVEARTNAGGNWLAVNRQSATTPASIDVSVNPAGLIEGSYSGAVTVSAPGAANSPQVVTVNLTVTAVNVTAVNLPNSAPAAQQIPFGLAVNPPSPSPIAGCLVASFVSDAVAPVDDPGVQFTGSGRMVPFTVPANASTIPPSQVPTIQTGTTAGIITVRGALQSCGSALSGTVLQTIRINRAAPVITSVEMVRSGAGIEVRVYGYATSRETQRAQFRFTAGPDFDLTVAELTIDVASAFQSWYQAPQSAGFGSMFRFVQPFSVQGDVNGIRSVTVTLTNAQGSGTSQPAGF